MLCFVQDYMIGYKNWFKFFKPFSIPVDLPTPPTLCPNDLPLQHVRVLAFSTICVSHQVLSLLLCLTLLWLNNYSVVRGRKMLGSLKKCLFLMDFGFFFPFLLYFLSSTFLETFCFTQQQSSSFSCSFIFIIEN